MKFAATLLFLSGASAFSTPGTDRSTSSLDATRVVGRAVSAAAIPSKALPYGGEKVPAIMDGTTPGDRGFDPVAFSNYDWADYFGILTQNFGVSSWTWIREAELMNGRNAMMGVVGMIVPYLFFGKTGSPLDVEGSELVPVVLTMGVLEWNRISRIISMQSDYQAGDMLAWGQPVGGGPSAKGDGRFNPFNLDYPQEEYEYLQLSEIKNGRLAMLGFLGLYFQAQNSGMNIVEQLGRGLASPEYATKVGHFFPEGI